MPPWLARRAWRSSAPRLRPAGCCQRAQDRTERRAVFPGYSPIDLLYAALAGCLVQSLRIAASEKQLLARLRSVSAEVKGRKAPDAPPRITHLDIVIAVEGDFGDATNHAVIARAEELCTRSNTLLGTPEFVVNKG